MKRVSPGGVQPAGAFGEVDSQGIALGWGSKWRWGRPAAETAAGLVAVWSTIRLLITRGWESTTLPVFWA